MNDSILNALRASPTARDRFFAKVDRSRGSESCWEWTAGTNAGGYGMFGLLRTSHLAHRVSWMLDHDEPIPHGLFVCHRCDNPPCVNPSHLFLGTVQDNADDMVLKGRTAWLCREAASRTHCPSGHPYAGENLRLTKDGYRMCAECKRATARKAYWKRRRALLDRWNETHGS